MTTYFIFINAPIRMDITYYQNERRGEKCIKVNGKAELSAKVNELRANGTKINSVRTEMGRWVTPSEIIN